MTSTAPHALILAYVTAHRAVFAFRSAHWIGSVMPAELVALSEAEDAAWAALVAEADRG